MVRQKRQQLLQTEKQNLQSRDMLVAPPFMSVKAAAEPRPVKTHPPAIPMGRELPEIAIHKHRPIIPQERTKTFSLSMS